MYFHKSKEVDVLNNTHLKTHIWRIMRLHNKLNHISVFKNVLKSSPENLRDVSERR